jgi:ectoine hydroxylase-related dioxygenase (phytanoyl-CoA dioxygenase family)
MHKPSLEVSSQSFQEYCAEGKAKALALGNRGPMRFDEDGRLDQSIMEAYGRYGFYVFTSVLAQQEIDDLTTEFDAVLKNAPSAIGSKVDNLGRPVKFPYYTLSENPHGDTVVGLVSHPLMMMDAALCVYAHPDILRMVESINGPDFVPFHEGIFHKGAGEGPPTDWHQDGRTHWAEDGSSLAPTGKTHGFNLNVSWSHCTPENCLWVVPGSHRHWCLANDGQFPPITARLADAVPMMLEPGDLGLVDRSSLHGSYPNRSTERRVTMTLGYHNRDSAINAETTNVHAFRRPGKVKKVKYSEDYVLQRARMIPLAIDARRQKYPTEKPYDYQGSYIGGNEWNDKSRREISEEGNEYWQRDITL